MERSFWHTSFHPDLFDWQGPAGAFRNLEPVQEVEIHGRPTRPRLSAIGGP